VKGDCLGEAKKGGIVGGEQEGKRKTFLKGKKEILAPGEGGGSRLFSLNAGEKKKKKFQKKSSLHWNRGTSSHPGEGKKSSKSFERGGKEKKGDIHLSRGGVLPSQK